MLAVCLLSALLSSLVLTQSDSASRPLVNTEEELTILETCEDVADGTRCTKRCVHWSCDPAFARCYQGHCKRAGHHPCNTASPLHPCCCGSCDRAMVVISHLARAYQSAKLINFSRTTQRIQSASITSRIWSLGRRRRAREKLKQWFKFFLFNNIDYRAYSRISH